MEHMDNPAHLRNSSHEEPSSQTMSNRARQPLLAVDGKDEGGKPVKLKMKLMKSNIQMIYIYVLLFFNNHMLRASQALITLKFEHFPDFRTRKNMGNSPKSKPQSTNEK